MRIPATRVLILTMNDDKFFTIEALKAGALGYLLKEDSFTQFVDGSSSEPRREICVCHAGAFRYERLCAPGSTGQGSVCRYSNGTRKEILQLITEGMTNQDMADLLCISTSTVDTHRKNLMSKLDVHSVAGLVKYAIKHKIVTI